MCNLAVKRARECYWAADRFVEDLWIMYSRAAVHYIDVWSIVTQRHHMDSLIWVNIVWGNDFMMTSSNGNSFSVTGVLWGESTDHRWIPLTKASDADFGGVFFICAWTNGWATSRDPGDLRRHRIHYDVTVMGWHPLQNISTFPVEMIYWHQLF